MGQASNKKWQARFQREVDRAVSSVKESFSISNKKENAKYWLAILISLWLADMTRDYYLISIGLYLITGLIGIRLVWLSFDSNWKVPLRAVCTCGLIIMCFFSVYQAIQGERKRELEKLDGPLTPANDLRPSSGCASDRQDLIILGRLEAASMEYPATVMKISDRSILTLNKGPYGLLVNLEVWDDDGKIIVDIQGNIFRINHFNYYEKKRPDLHTLIVYDQRKEMVLNVRYMNPSTIKITGKFKYKGRTVDVTDEHLDIDKMTRLDDLCVRNFKPGATAFHF
jgi:hypothetical protein